MLDYTEACLHNGNDPVFCQTTCSNIKLDKVVTGDSYDLLKCLPPKSVDLIITSPPYGERKKQFYGGIPPDEYVEWFIPIAREVQRVLKPSGSFVLNIKDRIVGKVRHPFVYELVLNLVKDGWKWIDTFVWHKKDPLPRRPTTTLKDGFEYIYHFSKTTDFKRNWKAVQIPMKGTKSPTIPNYDKNVYRTSGVNIKESNFERLDGLAYPSNVLHLAKSNKKSGHPAPYPEQLPEFFIKALTDKGDLVVDPFVGSGTTGIVAKQKGRHFIGFDKKEEYVTIANNRIANSGGIQ